MFGLVRDKQKEDFKMDPELRLEYKGTDRTKLYIVAVAVIVVTILVGFSGVFYLLLSDDPPTVISRDITFDMGDGVEHHEKATAEGDMLTFQSVDENFTAFFDHGRGIIMLKNLTSSRCYFTRLEELPDMGMNDMENIHPFYFRELEPGSEPMTVDPSMDLGYAFKQSDLIPTEYMKLTNSPVVANQCSSSESYWLIPQIGNLVKRDASFEIHIEIHTEYIDISFHWKSGS